MPEAPPPDDRAARVREAEQKVASALVELEAVLLNKPVDAAQKENIIRSSSPLEELDQHVKSDMEDRAKAREAEMARLEQLKEEAKSMFTRGLAQSCKQLIKETKNSRLTEEYIHRLISSVRQYVEDNYNEAIGIINRHTEECSTESKRNVLRDASIRRRYRFHKVVAAMSDEKKLYKQIEEILDSSLFWKMKKKQKDASQIKDLAPPKPLETKSPEAKSPEAVAQETSSKEKSVGKTVSKEKATGKAVSKDKSTSKTPSKEKSTAKAVSKEKASSDSKSASPVSKSAFPGGRSASKEKGSPASKSLSPKGGKGLKSKTKSPSTPTSPPQPKTPGGTPGAKSLISSGSEKSPTAAKKKPAKSSAKEKAIPSKGPKDAEATHYKSPPIKAPPKPVSKAAMKKDASPEKIAMMMKAESYLDTMATDVRNTIAGDRRTALKNRQDWYFGDSDEENYIIREPSAKLAELPEDDEMPDRELAEIVKKAHDDLRHDPKKLEKKWREYYAERDADIVKVPSVRMIRYPDNKITSDFYRKGKYGLRLPAGGQTYRAYLEAKNKAAVSEKNSPVIDKRTDGEKKSPVSSPDMDRGSVDGEDEKDKKDDKKDSKKHDRRDKKDDKKSAKENDKRDKKDDKKSSKENDKKDKKDDKKDERGLQAKDGKHKDGKTSKEKYDKKGSAKSSEKSTPPKSEKSDNPYKKDKPRADKKKTSSATSLENEKSSDNTKPSDKASPSKQDASAKEKVSSPKSPPKEGVAPRADSPRGKDGQQFLFYGESPGSSKNESSPRSERQPNIGVDYSNERNEGDSLSPLPSKAKSDRGLFGRVSSKASSDRADMGFASTNSGLAGINSGLAAGGFKVNTKLSRDPQSGIPPLTPEEKAALEDMEKWMIDLVYRSIADEAVHQAMNRTITEEQVKERKRIYKQRLERASQVEIKKKEKLDFIPPSSDLIKSVVDRLIWRIACECDILNEEAEAVMRFSVISSAQASLNSSLLPPDTGVIFPVKDANYWTQKLPSDLKKYGMCQTVLAQMRHDIKKKRFAPRTAFDWPTAMREKIMAGDRLKAEEEGKQDNDVARNDKKDADDDLPPEETDAVALKLSEVPMYKVLNSKNVVSKGSPRKDEVEDEVPEASVAAVAASKEGGVRFKKRRFADRDVEPPMPLRFDPRSHPSWLDERKAFYGSPHGQQVATSGASARAAMQEFCTIDRNEPGTVSMKGYPNSRGLSGYISKCVCRYTRPLGIIIAIGTERGYLGDNYIYTLSLNKSKDGTSKYLINFKDIKKKKTKSPRGKKGADDDEVLSPRDVGNPEFDVLKTWDKRPVITRMVSSDKKWHDLAISTDGSRLLAVEGNTVAVFQLPADIEDERKPGEVPLCHRALEIEPKHLKRLGQEEYDVAKLSPQRVCFFSELSLFGSNESGFVGCKDGSLIKLNYGNRSKVLPEAVDFKTPGFDYLPVFWEDSKPTNEKKRLEWELTHHTWHTVPKEYFERHDASIKSLGCTQTDAVIWSFDEKNLICCWRYALKHRTGFGSFRPICAWRLHLDDQVFDFVKEEDHHVTEGEHEEGHGHGFRPVLAGHNNSTGSRMKDIGRHRAPEDEYKDIDLIENEHFLYPFGMDDYHIYYPAPDNGIYRVAKLDFQKIKVPVHGDPKYAIKAKPVDDGMLHDAADKSATTGGGGMGQLFIGRRNLKIGSFGEEHLYGVKVPLLASFKGYGRRPKGQEVLQFTYFGKTAAVLYRVQRGLVRILVFSCETEAPNAEEEFTTVGGKKGALAKNYSPHALLMKPEESLKLGQSLGGSSPGATSPGATSAGTEGTDNTTKTEKKKEKKGGGYLGSAFAAVTAPVNLATNLATNVTTAAIGTGASKKKQEITDGETRKTIGGKNQNFYQMPTPSDDGATWFPNDLPKPGTRAARILADTGEPISENDTDDEELSYFTAATWQNKHKHHHEDDDDDDDDTDDESGHYGKAKKKETDTIPEEAEEDKKHQDQDQDGEEDEEAEKAKNIKKPDVDNEFDPVDLSKRQRKQEAAKQPIKSLAKIKLQLPYRPNDTYITKPMICLFKNHCWVVDEINIYCFSIKTGQCLLQYEHGILDPESSKADERNPEDDNGILPNIISVQIMNVYAPKLVLMVATNHVVKFYWVPGFS